MGALRDGTTGCVVVSAVEVSAMRPVLLPKVWAVGEEVEAVTPPAQVSEVRPGAPGPVAVPAETVPPDSDQEGAAWSNAASEGAASPQVPVELAFYRRYTEGMLRRYVRLSMAAGRVPSLLGRELFRGQVTSYRMHNFEDVVIFCHDMERVLDRMQPQHQELLKRVGMQQYSQGEAAGVMGMSLAHLKRLYNEALDRLTQWLLEGDLLDRRKSCQEGR
jgi:predicted DNA-binding protein (UPF0251 family)